jgi:hypothetical protein
VSSKGVRTIALAWTTMPTGQLMAVAPANPPRASMTSVQTATTGLASPYWLMMRAARRTWIRVRMDNGQTYEERLKAGAVRVWMSDQPAASASS